MAITGASGAPYGVRLSNSSRRRARRVAHRLVARLAAARHGDRRRRRRRAAAPRGRRALGCARDGVRRRRPRRRAGVRLRAHARHGDLSVLDGHARVDRGGHVALARRARGRRDAQGAAAARAGAARDAAQRDPPREHAAPDARRRRRAAGVAGILPPPGGIADLVDFVVARMLDHLGVGASAERTVGRRGAARGADANEAPVVIGLICRHARPRASGRARGIGRCRADPARRRRGRRRHVWTSSR